GGAALVHDLVPEPDNALGQEEGDENEERAQGEEPELGQDGGEPGFAEIDDDGADDRADQRAAAAHSSPDDHLDGIARLELAGVDDADLRHVERPGNARHDGRDGEGEKFDVFNAVAEKTGSALGVADGNHDLAE